MVEPGLGEGRPISKQAQRSRCAGEAASRGLPHSVVPPLNNTLSNPRKLAKSVGLMFSVLTTKKERGVRSWEVRGKLADCGNGILSRLTKFSTSRRCVFICSSFSSVQLSRSVASDSSRPHEPQHARPPCPSPTPRVHPNPCPLCR